MSLDHLSRNLTGAPVEGRLPSALALDKLGDSQGRYPVLHDQVLSAVAPNSI